MSSSAKIYLYAVINGKVIRSKLAKLTGQGKWKKLKLRLKLNAKTPVKIGVKGKDAGGWGTMDDFALIRADAQS